MISYFERIKLLQEELNTSPALIHNIFEGSPEQPIRFDLFDSLVTDWELKKTVEKLFRDGHHARAVEEGYKFLDNLVKRTAGTESSLTGSKLMTTVFSPGNPILRVNSGVTMSEEDEQKGYMQILSGCMTGIRNPRAHEHEWEDTEFRALQLLSLANHLVQRVRDSHKISSATSDD